MMNQTEWLAQLKAGDTVIVHSGYNDTNILKVDAATATQIVIGNWRYNRKDGSRRGSDGSMYRSWLQMPTPEILERVERKNLIHGIRQLVMTNSGKGWRDMPLEELRKLAKTLEDKQ